MRHVIEVTEEDILEARAIRKARLKGLSSKILSEWCPVALAARRTFDEEYVSVGDTDLKVGRVLGRAKLMFGLPDEARRFIEAFDLGDGVGPISFVVEDGQ